jgi:arginyl-tRNA--protein-N-Asp/Glu arginylyltransferase
MFNIKNNLSIEDNYQQGLLPQRNYKILFYQDDNYSSRCCLDSFKLSSENKRILNKTKQFNFQKIPLSDFRYNLIIQKEISAWVKKLNWDFPTSSIKTVFTNHIFNYLYIWSDQHQSVVAYSLCYFDKNFSAVAYVFYNPIYAHQDLPIRLALQGVIDSANSNLKYCYIGRFNPVSKLGYYKRNFPGFQYFTNNHWISYK